VSSKLIIISLLTALLIIAAAMIIGFLSSDPSLTSHDYLSEYEINKSYYLGYRIGWKGTTNPTVKNVFLLDSNKKIIKNQQSNSYLIEFFVDQSKNIGSVPEEDYQEKHIQFSEVQNYKVKDKDINIVMKVKMFDDYLKKAKYLGIEYKVFGLVKTDLFEITVVE
jgi:hypothetical protein